MTRLYVDVHVLQTVPPSNLNRDDAGAPKQAVYGGVRRARVSSQAWKRASRKAFSDLDSTNGRPLGTRTKRLRELLEQRFVAAGHPGDTVEDWSQQALTALGVPADTGRGKKTTAYLLFLGVAQIDALARHVEERLAAGEPLAASDVRALLGQGHPLDVALFGRMVANLADLNVDAATQVAHALSTHAVDTEFDYFTAVDDENEKGETGAGMIGTVEFTSATLYRYANVGVHQLQDNLDHDEAAVLDGLRGFLTAFVTSMPSGHQNSFAHRTQPELVTFVVRDDQPVNLVSAFEDPVTGPGVATRSVQRLASELDRSTRLWGAPPRVVLSTYEPRTGLTDGELAPLGELVPFPTAVSRVLDVVRAAIPVPSPA
jgi:CRISPR system Cascade subunit CasC